MTAAGLRDKVEAILDEAVNDHECEARLRFTHRIALKRLGSSGAESHPDFATWKRQERRAWVLIQALNQRIFERRIDIVGIDEEIARLERLSDANPGNV